MRAAPATRTKKPRVVPSARGFLREFATREAAMKVRALAREARVVVLLAPEVVAAIDAYRRRSGTIPRAKAIRQLIEKGRKAA